MEECQHTSFDAYVSVGRLHKDGQPLIITDFVADLSVVCRDCGCKFRFQGFKHGIIGVGIPMISADGTQISLPIVPTDEYVDQGPKRISEN